MLIETVLQIVTHATDEEAVGITALNLGKIVILYAINKLLYHDSGSHLCIIHVGEEYLGGVHTVNDKRRYHLYLLIQEDTAPVLHGADDFPVPCGVLSQPQVAVCVDDYEFLHLTNI